MRCSHIWPRRRKRRLSRRSRRKALQTRYFVQVISPQRIRLKVILQGIGAICFLTMSSFERNTGSGFSVEGHLQDGRLTDRRPGMSPRRKALPTRYHDSSGLRDSGLKIRDSDFRFRDSRLRFQVRGLGFQVLGLGFQVSGLGIRVLVSEVGFWVLGFGFRDSGCRFWDLDCRFRVCVDRDGLV